MISVYIHGQQSNDNSDGISQVIAAQRKYLKSKVSLVRAAGKADVIACHTDASELERVDVLHIHNLYFHDLPGSYSIAHGNMNRKMLESIRRARFVTVPSEFIAYPLRRDLRIDPIVIRHGIDFEDWHGTEGEEQYILWNKNRNTDVCSPYAAHELAWSGKSVYTTFGESVHTKAMRILGTLPHSEMKKYIEKCYIYLSTTPESFGIGILEAIASGKPVLGYNWGNIPEIIENTVEGILAAPEDLSALCEGYDKIVSNYEYYSKNALEKAKQFSWEEPMQKYMELYEEAAKPEHFSIAIALNGKYIVDVPKGVEVVSDPIIDKAIARAKSNLIITATGDIQFSKEELDKLAAPIMSRECDISYPHNAVGWPGQFTVAGHLKGEFGSIHPNAMFRKSMWEKVGGMQDSMPEFFTKALSFASKVQRIDVVKEVTHYTKPEYDWLPWVNDNDYPVGLLTGQPNMFCSYSMPLVTVIVDGAILSQVYNTLESVYVQRANAEVIVTSNVDLGVYKHFARFEKKPTVHGDFIVALKAGELLHPTALLEMLAVIENHDAVCADIRIRDERMPDGRRILSKNPTGEDVVYYPEVCLYTEYNVACANCGGKKKTVLTFGGPRTMRCKLPTASSYIGKNRYSGRYGETVEVQAGDVGPMLETGAWELVIVREVARQEPKKLLK